MRAWLRPLVAGLAVVGLSAGAMATWSVIAVDLATGEVAIASATCLANFDLQRALPVLVVGKGAAAAQSAVDQGAVNRAKLFAALQNGVAPAAILAQLAQEDPSHQVRQYGIVDLVPQHAPVTFTGNGAGAAKGGVTGQIGTIRYAIQGNILTAPQVLSAARSALIGTQGDLGQRVAAAMEAARALGGDGRCSCSSIAPTSCGAPPPGFQKSAHTAFFLIARAGDVDGVCNAAEGCANGSYYLALNEIGGPGTTDPVLVLDAEFQLWRAALAGRPDHYLSTVTPSAARLPADGTSSSFVRVQLVDVNGVPLTAGGATLSVAELGATGLVSTSAVLDFQDGSYAFAVDAKSTPGEVQLQVTVDDGQGAVTLGPPLAIVLDPPAALHAGFAQVSASAGALVPLTLDFGAADATSPYLVLVGASGLGPGVPLGAGLVPLVPDAVVALSIELAGSALLPQSVGLLDGAGRALAGFAPPPGLLGGLVGGELQFCAVALGSPEQVSPPIALGIGP
ncbi:MAG: DUF1028 domain-containing protein [Planctomycetaceae bacterium]|nr:DUF1028 domain-containing protein [Planctomycetaceae bacterium]